MVLGRPLAGAKNVLAAYVLPNAPYGRTWAASVIADILLEGTNVNFIAPLMVPRRALGEYLSLCGAQACRSAYIAATAKSDSSGRSDASYDHQAESTRSARPHPIIRPLSSPVSSAIW